jgi:hypothetical protein
LIEELKTDKTKLETKYESRITELKDEIKEWKAKEENLRI